MNQFRKHHRVTLIDRLRVWYTCRCLGKVGPGVFIGRRVGLLRYPDKIRLGRDVVIKHDAELCVCNQSSTITVGERTTIGSYTFVYASAGITIGNDCMIAPFVYLVDSDHGTKKGTLMNQQSNVTAPITIGSDVWIGTRAVITRGVVIGDGAVIAAGAVVRDDVASGQIVAGVPARIIGERV